MNLGFWNELDVENSQIHIGGGEEAANPTYAEILRDTYNASEIFPLVNIASGTDIPAFINSVRDGALVGWDLQNISGPVPNTLAPYSNSNDVGNIYTSDGSNGLADIFDGTIGSIFIWGRKSAWSGVQWFFNLEGSSTSFAIWCAHNAGTFYWNYSNKLLTKAGISITNWFSAGISWKDGNNGDEMKAFWLGSQEGATQTGVVAWTGGAIQSTKACLGARYTTPSNTLDGYLAYCAVKFGSIWSPTDFLNMHNDAASAAAD